MDEAHEGGGVVDVESVEEVAEVETQTRGLVGVILASLMWAVTFGTGAEENDEGDEDADDAAEEEEERQQQPQTQTQHQESVK